MYKSTNYNKSNGFTIVELLVVIIVIGVLAAITIVAYTGIQNRAVVASLVSDLSNSAQQLKLFQIDNSGYPTPNTDTTPPIDCTTTPTPANKICFKASPGNSYTNFQINNSTNPQSFCMAIKNTNGTSYYIANDTVPTVGDCAGIITNGLVLSLDAGNTMSYPGSGSVWTDLSGNGNNGTLKNNAIYTAADSGAIILDGVNSFVRIPDSPSISPKSNSVSINLWYKMNSVGSINASILYNKENLYEASGGGGRFTYAWQPYWSWVDSYAVNVGEWNDVVVVYNNVSQSVYKNGVLVYTRPQSGAIGSNNLELDIGARSGGASSYLPGSVSIFQMYNRALSQAEITQNFNTFRGRYSL